MTDSNGPRIGWIGTGRMGFAMAHRLIAGGYDVAVWNRTRAKAEPLASVGAAVVDTVADLADRDIVFTMVSASEDFEAVLLGDGGVLQQDVVPRIIVDCSTVSEAASSRVRAAAAERGAALLAAPVSGNAKVAKAGRLTFIVSGPEESFHEVRPLLAAIGPGVTYAGDGELARLVKVAHNVFLGVVAQSLAEITVLAEKGGVKRSAFLGFLNDSVLGSTFSRYKSPAFVNLEWTPTFTMELLRKDLQLGLDAARDMGATLPLAALTHQLTQAAIGRGHGELDFAALLLEQARSSDLDLKAENITVADGLSS
jgi:3-hydroxyisobutyrate dehydrogenase